MDIFSQEKRSEVMSKIRGKNTKPERILRKALYSRGFRYRLHVKDLPGKPDIVLRKYKTVIFVNGCFWHGHACCKFASIPKSNTDFWLNKIVTNQRRDQLSVCQLQADGWNVLTIWECEIMHQPDLTTLLDRIVDSLYAQLQNKRKVRASHYLTYQEAVQMAAEQDVEYGD